MLGILCFASKCYTTVLFLNPWSSYLGDSQAPPSHTASVYGQPLVLQVSIQFLIFVFDTFTLVFAFSLPNFLIHAFNARYGCD